MIAASVLLAGLLMLIGVLVLSTAAGERPQTPTTTSAAQAGAAPAALSRANAALRSNRAMVASLRSSLLSDRATITHLRVSLFTQSVALSGATVSLKAAQANARCWHAKVVHPIRARRRRCAPVP